MTLISDNENVRETVIGTSYEEVKKKYYFSALNKFPLNTFAKF